MRTPVRSRQIAGHGMHLVDALPKREETNSGKRGHNLRKAGRRCNQKAEEAEKLESPLPNRYAGSQNPQLNHKLNPKEIRTAICSAQRHIILPTSPDSQVRLARTSLATIRRGST